MRAALAAVLALLALAASASAAEQRGDRAITKVIKLLQDITVKSKEAGDQDTSLFAKFKCYCDTNLKAKKASIVDNERMIELLAGEIADLKASNGMLSTQTADLQMRLTDNENQIKIANTLRDKEQADFEESESDMVDAMGQMSSALETLSAVGGDQTALLRTASEVDNAKFMAKDASLVRTASVVEDFSVSKVSEGVRSALQAASALLPPKEKRKVTSFLQGVGGDYSSASGEIVGILKNMRDTFQANLKASRATEAAAKESHRMFTEVKEEELETMKASYEDKEKILAANDETMSAKKEAKEEAETSIAADEDFVDKLVPICKQRAKEYEDRKVVRAQEEAAVSQAISILNSDAAFDTFGATTAATEGGASFLQVKKRSMRQSVRARVAAEVRREAGGLKSLRLARLAVALEGGNPLDKVVAEVDKMKEVIAKEAKQDDEQKAWCDSERTENAELKGTKEDAIDGLDTEVEELTETLDGKETGLRKQLADEEAKLAMNQKEQAASTEERNAEHSAYQVDVRNLAEAAKLLKSATKSLKEFYEWLQRKQGPHHYEEHDGKDSGGAIIKRIPEASIDELKEACSAEPNCAGFNAQGNLKSAIAPEGEWYDAKGTLYVKAYDTFLAQTKAREEPAPPEDDGGQAGQGESGNKAIDMLEQILTDTEEEEKQAHKDEEDAQADFEAEMADLKKAEGASSDLIASLKEQVNSAAEKLIQTQEERAKVQGELEGVLAYLAKIKPGCDFITKNIEMRREHREKETEVLTNAVDSLKGTPAYKKAQEEAEAAEQGECAPKCKDKGNDHADCKACIAGTTVEGYCGGHPDTPGC